MSDDLTLISAPFLVNHIDWKEVKLKIKFSNNGEPLVVEIDTDDLTVQEEQRLCEWLGAK